MGLIAGVVGVVVAYLACYTAHGASNPMHTTAPSPGRWPAPDDRPLDELDGRSARGALGGIVLAALADATSVSTAMVAGGIILAVAAPLYLPALRQEQAGRRADGRPIGRPSPRRLGGVSDAAVRVERLPDARAFLDAAGVFLERREAEHNLLFGIAANLVVDPGRSMTAPPQFAVVRRTDEVVAAAVMTPPFNLVLSLTDDQGDARPR